MAIRMISKEDAERLAKAIEGPAYTAVGLGVLAFQRAQVHRVEAQRALGRLGGTARSMGEALGEELGHEVSARTAPLRQKATDLTGEALAHLPDPARQLLDAVGNLVVELPHEAKSLAGEVVALSRFAWRAAGSPASRFASRQAS